MVEVAGGGSGDGAGGGGGREPLPRVPFLYFFQNLCQVFNLVLVKAFVEWTTENTRQRALCQV